MGKLSFVAAMSLALLSLSCSKVEKDTCERCVDMANAKPTVLEVPDSSLVKLQSGENMALYDVCNMERIKGNYYIHSRDNLRVFDSDGRYCFDIGGKGKASNEYTGISNFYVEGDTICLYDFMSRKLVRYDLEGRCLDVVELSAKIPEDNVAPNHVYETGSGYVLVNSYGGDYRSVSCLSKADHALNTILAVEGRNLSSGLSFPDDVCMHGDKVYYWEPLCDTLFVCEGQYIRPYCHFDMGTNGLPYDVTQKDVYDRIAYVNRMYEEGKHVAGAIRYYSACGKMLFFVFNDTKGGVSVGMLDTETFEIKVYEPHYSLSSFRTQPFLKIVGHDILLVAEDTDSPEENPYLVIMNVDTFLDNVN